MTQVWPWLQIATLRRCHPRIQNPQFATERTCMNLRMISWVLCPSLDTGLPLFLRPPIGSSPLLSPPSFWGQGLPPFVKISLGSTAHPGREAKNRCMGCAALDPGRWRRWVFTVNNWWFMVDITGNMWANWNVSPKMGIWLSTIGTEWNGSDLMTLMYNWDSLGSMVDFFKEGWGFSQQHVGIKLNGAAVDLWWNVA